ncbi:L-seryl-tRNA(Sec) selenium transferase [Halalkalibacterium ligniniphilum]|uniref:L-seryl-tRNA(Sec) selenium transferase n=1 Tax=Halalkalibacterium ligniniphilum TaxID=1134413 RepID=UPI00037D6623|nr:L-seryl-tRNA(Sec) selenium transferase [Halalkalibacterium ligniniphilum]
MKEMLRQLPPIHELQKDERFTTLLENQQVEKDKLTEWVQEAVSELRHKVLNDEWTGEPAHISDFIFKGVTKRFHKHTSFMLRRVINGTGTILHTNLGRARLSEEALNQVMMTAANYSNLEYSIQEGKRGSRHDLIEELVKEVTGAEAAMVVNNNAAAVYFVLSAFAKGKEVIVSRGQLVEIGGSFRVSSIMEESGAKLVEVGTTNKTHLFDYANAITENTAMMMKVHTSNFRTIGFTSTVSTPDMVTLAKENGILSYEDLGSGALYDLHKHGIGNEPTVKETLESGIDLVTFSGDKLLGGPQAGIIAGKKIYIDRLKKHQLARVLRVDKMTLAALEATLKAYSNQEQAAKQLPTLRAILASSAEIKERALQFAKRLPDDWIVSIVPDTSKVGGGTMPEVEIDTFLLMLEHRELKAQSLAEKLRLGDIAVVTRLKEDKVALDFRTIDASEEDDLYDCIQKIELKELGEIE